MTTQPEDKLTIRSVEDIDSLRKWLEGRTWDDVEHHIRPDTITYILTHKGKRAGVVVLVDPPSIHRNALRMVGQELHR